MRRRCSTSSSPITSSPETLSNNGVDSPEFQLTTDTNVMNLTNSLTKCSSAPEAATGTQWPEQLQQRQRLGSHGHRSIHDRREDVERGDPDLDRRTRLPPGRGLLEPATKTDDPELRHQSDQLPNDTRRCRPTGRCATGCGRSSISSSPPRNTPFRNSSPYEAQSISLPHQSPQVYSATPLAPPSAPPPWETVSAIFISSTPPSRRDRSLITRRWSASSWPAGTIRTT